MTLRRRLLLTLALTALPLMGGLAWLRGELFRRAEQQGLRSLLLARAASLGQAACESSPSALLPGPGHLRVAHESPLGPGMAPPAAEPGPGGGPPMRHGPQALQAFAYDAAFASADPKAPPFPDDLRRRLADGASEASGRRGLPGGGQALDVAVRSGWPDGPCAVLLARRSLAGPPPPLWGPLLTTLPLLAVLLAAVWLAAGPVVRRIRELSVEVRRSAASRYAQAVPVRGRDEVADLARAFNEAGAEVRAHLATLEQRDQALRTFLANTTHDVMLPLTVLQGHLSNLRQSAHDGQPPDEGVLVAALQEAHYMASLLHNLGAAAKLEAAEALVLSHPVRLDQLVERVVARHRPVAEPAGIEVVHSVPEQPLEALGDVTLLEQAVSNVVHNAVRYNRRGGHVAVLLEALAGPPPGFLLRVVDDGPGVPRERLALLAQRRWRADEARQRDPTGLGLGLDIARGVAERHGFELRLGPSQHGGLEVTLSGPLRPPPAPPS